MKQWIFLTVLFLFAVNFCNAQVQHFTLNDLEKMKKTENDTLYILNFWATWCKPCVAEIPYFEQADSTYKKQKVKIILVSLDFPQMIPGKLLEFAASRGLKTTIMWMAETDENKWINAVSPDWSGAIPATLFVQGSKQVYQFRGSGYTSFADLKADIEKAIPK